MIYYRKLAFIRKLKNSLTYGINYKEASDPPSDNIIESIYTGSLDIQDTLLNSPQFNKRSEKY